MENIKITELYDLTKTIAADYLNKFTYPFEALKGITELIISLGEKLDSSVYEKRGECLGGKISQGSSYGFSWKSLYHR